jgi:hypothetical protein
MTGYTNIGPILSRKRQMNKLGFTSAALAMVLLGSSASAQTIQTLDGRPITADEIQRRLVC